MLFREALQVEEEDAYERVRACNRKCNKTSLASLSLSYECGSGDANYMTIAIEERQRLYLSNSRRSRRTVKKKKEKKETKKKIYLSLVA